MTQIEAWQNLTALHWVQGSAYHVESTCGRFNISKNFSGENARYILWRKREGQRPEMIGIHDTYDAAKVAAERLNHG